MQNWINKRIRYIFAAPAVVLTLGMIVYPLLYSFYMSFHDWNMSVKVEPVWVGLKNYTGLLADSTFQTSFVFTVKYTVIAVTVEMILGVALALFISKLGRGSGFVKTATILPMVTSPIVVGLLWKIMMDPAIGVFNTLLRAAGLPTSSWLTSKTTVLPSLIIIDAWFGIPLIVLMVLSGITSLPTDCYEAAYVDGATELQAIRKITLPLLKPTLKVVLLLRMIDSLKTFDIIYSSTLGGPQNSSLNLNYLVYKNTFEYFKLGKASAILMLFLLLIFATTIIMISLSRKKEDSTNG